MRDPPFLYKYRAVDGDSLLRLLATLERSELYFASPPELNDPFDCKVNLSFKAPLPVIEKALHRALARRRPELSRADRVRQASQWMRERKFQTVEFQRGLEGELQGAVNGLSVLCLSAKPNDLLMWSYYSGGHTGVCLQFSLDRHEVFLGRAAPVRYSRRYPNVNVLRLSPRAQVNALFFTKAHVWKHEAEWRIVDKDLGPGLRIFPADLLTGIIIGSRIPGHARDQVFAVAKSRIPPPRLFEAVVRQGGFGVEIRPLLP